MSSKRRLRRRACERKHVFYDETSAVAAAVSLQRAKGDRVQAYRCEHCRQWHVGHPSGKVRQAMADRRKQAERRG